MPPVHPAHLTVDHACLIVHGSDKPGIVAAVSAMITRIGGNIVAFDQFSDDHRGGAYFQRVVFHLHRHPLHLGIEARALRHRPTLQRVAHLQPEVVVAVAGMVQLDHEDRPMARAAAPASLSMSKRTCHSGCCTDQT